jgi:hypothetical protein
MAEIAEIVDKLLERTNQNKIGWQPTVTENTFLAVVGKLGVSIALPRQALINDFVRFRIFDETGQLIKEIYADRVADGVTYYKLREIHQKAKRMALGDEGCLDELLAELDKV